MQQLDQVTTNDCRGNNTAYENSRFENKLTHLSLFSGVGGLDIGAEWADMVTVGQCEWNSYATRVLKKRWPNVARWKDIRTLTRESFYEKTGLRTVDVISGGFPCQPFSSAGKRRGKNDDRFLWPEMCRVIEELRPPWIIGENVAGIVSMAEPTGSPDVESRSINRLPDEDYFHSVLSQQEILLLHQILESLERISYEVQTFIIPACGVDANHQRYRVAILGHSQRHGLSATEEPRGPGEVCGDRREGEKKVS